MALDQSFSFSSNTNGTTLTLSDDTGSYDAISNVTGYGAPNTVRTNLGIIVYGYLKGVDADIDLGVSAVSDDPNDVISFATSYNGWHQFLVYSIPVLGTETNVEGNLRYNAGGNVIEAYIGASWAALATTVPVHQALYPGNNVLEEQVEYNHLPLFYQGFNNTVKLISLGCNCCDVSDLREYRNEVLEKIDACKALFTDGDYYEYQAIVEGYEDRAQKIVDLS